MQACLGSKVRQTDQIEHVLKALRLRLCTQVNRRVRNQRSLLHERLPYLLGTDCVLTLKFNLVGAESEIVVDETGFFARHHRQHHSLRPIQASLLAFCTGEATHLTSLQCLGIISGLRNSPWLAGSGQWCQSRKARRQLQSFFEDLWGLHSVAKFFKRLCGAQQFPVSLLPVAILAPTSNSQLSTARKGEISITAECRRAHLQSFAKNLCRVLTLRPFVFVRLYQLAQLFLCSRLQPIGKVCNARESITYFRPGFRASLRSSAIEIALETGFGGVNVASGTLLVPLSWVPEGLSVALSCPGGASGALDALVELS